MEEQLIPIIKTGQYQGKPVTDIMGDEKFINFLKSKGHLTPNNPNWGGPIYNILVNQQLSTNKDGKTPVHNELQAKFLKKTTQEKLINNCLGYLTIRDDIYKELQLLYNDEVFKRCIGEFEPPMIETNVDKSKITCEGMYNWDIIFNYIDRQSYSIQTRLDIELHEKSNYKQQYDLNEEIKHKKILDYYDKHIEQLKIKDEKLNEEYNLSLENYEKAVKEYPSNLELYKLNKAKNELEVKNRENEIVIYNKKKEIFKQKKLLEICQDYNVSSEKYLNWLKYSDKDNYHTENEKKQLKELINKELTKHMCNWCQINIEPLPIKKLSIPIEPRKPIKPSKATEYCYIEDLPTGMRRQYSRLNDEQFRLDKLAYEENYGKEYEEKFNKQYKEHRIGFYKSILDKNLKICKANISILDNGQFNISIQTINANTNIYGEIKPTLGEDFPCVLRKMRTQIELTKREICNKKFQNMKFITDVDRKKYENEHRNDYINIPLNTVLILGKFEAEKSKFDDVKDMFLQQHIKIIFTEQLFDCPIGNVKQIIHNENNNKLIEENSHLKEQLLKAEEKNKELQIKIIELENMIRSMNENKPKTKIQDYFKKNNIIKFL